MRIVIALAAGTIFGAGLVLSDMINPARVLGFLTLTSGAWDPTLAFVMGGAMLPMSIAWRIAGRKESPAFGSTFPSAPTGKLDRKLFLGAILFGVGWGVIGLCPGPAFAGLLLGGWPVALFVGATLAGMALHKITRA